MTSNVSIALINIAIISYVVIHHNRTQTIETKAPVTDFLVVSNFLLAKIIVVFSYHLADSHHWVVK